MTGPTRPTSEQLRLVSSKTGEHILDTYLEAAEKGNRTLPDLLDDLFNSSGSFYRGSGLYNWKGNYTNGTPYITGDTFKSASTGSIYVALRNFTASNNLAQEITDNKISLVFDGANIVAAQNAATAAANSATAAATSATNAASSATTASTQASNASTSAAAASGSATAASTSATAAAGSATAASNSATAAASSASAASSSQSAASTSATNAQTSATAAAASQATASSAATASQTSATNSAGSASTAAGHATTAATQATAAANSATTAATQATNAANSATAASGSASTASTQASNAANSATNAANSATAAASSATSASNSASTATTQASTATTQATNAATSASSAATQASNAATSATNAANSATSAATEATNAANSATSAASARDAALAAFDSFDDRYLGTKSADPTVDNDGDPLVAGALYFSSTDGVMKLYTGSAWVAAYVAGTDFILKTGDTMTGQLTLNANLAVDTNTLFADATTDRVGIGTATPATKTEILGSTPVAAQFFADAVSGTTLNVTTLVSGALAVGQYLGSGNGRVRITALGTGTGGVGTYTLDTDQTGLNFTRSYADAPTTMRLGNSATAWDRNIPYGTIEFGGAITNTGPRGYIQAQASTSASPTSTGSLIFGVGQTNGAAPPRTVLNLGSFSALLSGNLFLGVSQLSPRNLSVSPSYLSLSGRSQTIYSSGQNLSYLTFATSYIDATVETFATYGQLGYQVDSSITSGQLPSNFYIQTRNASGTLAERFRINKDGNVGIGTTNPAAKLEVNGNAQITQSLVVGTASTLVVDTANQRVGVNTGIPSETLEVKGSGLFRDSPSFGGLKLRADTLGNAYIDNLSNGQFYISNNGAVRLHITDIGSVGIGTTGLPNAKLNVAQDGVSSVPVPASTAVMRIESGPTGPSETILQVAAGVGSASIYLGVGSLAGSTRIVSSGASGGLLIQENSGGPMAFSVGGERMRIDASGNVGIGTSSPSAPLHVLTSTLSTGIIIDSTDDSAVSGPSLVLRRSSPSPAASDFIGQIFFQGLDSTGVATNFARIIGRIEDPVNGSEDGSLFFHTTQAGSSTTAAIMSSVGDFTATGNVTAYSDRRLKANLEPIHDALAKVLSLTGYTYERIDTGERQTGVVAQEVKRILPEAVIDKGEHLAVAYGNMVGLLIQAIKEQQAQIDDLTRRLAS